MLSAVWLGLMVVASTTIVMATSVVQQRALLQSSADAVALALAQRGITDAQRLAEHLGVTIASTDYSDQLVTVMIRNESGSSRATAHR